MTPWKLAASTAGPHPSQMLTFTSLLQPVTPEPGLEGPARQAHSSVNDSVHWLHPFKELSASSVTPQRLPALAL